MDSVYNGYGLLHLLLSCIGISSGPIKFATSAPSSPSTTSNSVVLPCEGTPRVALLYSRLVYKYIFLGVIPVALHFHFIS